MSRNTLYKKFNYFLLLSVSKIVKLIVRFFVNDADIFFKRYAFLNAEPREAWHYFKLCCNDVIEYAAVKKPNFFSIALKLSLAFSVMIVISLISLMLILNTHQQQTLIKQQTEFSQLFSSQATETLKIPLLVKNHPEIQKNINQLVSLPKIISGAIYTEDHALIYSSGFNPQKHQSFPKKSILSFNPINSFNTLNSLENILNYFKNLFGSDKYFVIYTVPIQYEHLVIGHLSLCFDYSIIKSSQLNTLHDFISISSLCVLIGILFSFHLSKLITKPLSDLLNASDAIHKINAGQDKSQHKYKRRDELEVLMASMNDMNKGALHKDKVEAVFSRYVSPQVAHQVLNDLENIDNVELGGKHIMASVFFADIVGFTNLSENLDPQEISELLNVYFSKITKIVSFCGGHVDKFMGDCAMVLFGVPVKNEKHAFDCIACAWMILKLLEELNKQRQTSGERTVEFRIGVNTGMMLAGNMGSNERMEYTVVGDSVNLASRLCGTGEPGELIMTEDVFVEQELEGLIDVQIKDFIKLRGKRLPVKTLIVEDVLTPFKQKMLDEIPKIIEKSASE